MIERNGQLAAAIREVKNAAADRDDVVIEMREAERMRLELLAAELAPMIAEVPQDVDLFDFAISSGLQPRFWIDAVSFVGMGRDKRTFRFVRDTRLGRVVLAESSDVKPVAKQVTLYVAERLIERQRLQEGNVAPVRRFPSESEAVEDGMGKEEGRAEGQAAVEQSRGVAVEVATRNSWVPFFSGLGLVLLGALAAAVVAASFYWDRLDFSRLGLDRFGL
jgi:hypothetical protein